MDKEYYYKKLYPLQDKVLRIINDLDTGFYLTGGTASSRGYLHHRFSDDIALFVNDDHRFGLWADRIIHSVSASAEKKWGIEVLQREVTASPAHRLSANIIPL